MAEQKSPSTLIVGLAFFSMFFGSGNLIFPLILGSQYESHFLIGALGFIITAVLLPTLGILVMLPARGRYETLFIDLLPNRYARWFFFAVLLFWIPLGSGPRCVVLAHASLNAYFDQSINLALFSTIFLAFVYICVRTRSKIISILGKWLTPLLLIAIFFIVVISCLQGELNHSSVKVYEVFLDSLVSGYYTQDLIAAIFFSAALVSMLKLDNENPAIAIRKTWHGGLIAVVMLAILYAALMAASALHADQLRGLSGEQLVSQLALIALGQNFGSVSSVAVSLACLTTEIALVIVFADFINAHVLGGRKDRYAMVITLIIIWLMAQLEFAGIMAIVSPAMKIIYPALFLLVVRFLWRKRNGLTDNLAE